MSANEIKNLTADQQANAENALNEISDDALNDVVGGVYSLSALSDALADAAEPQVASFFGLKLPF